MIRAVILVVVLLNGLGRAEAESMVISPPPQFVPTTVVASLPACSASNNGIIYKVTDALTPVVLAAVVGGGAVTLLVQCNGTNFIVG